MLQGFCEVESVKVHRLRTVQCLPVGLGEAWDFFSDPRNLARITPPDLGLVVEGDPEPMYAGQILTYRVRPFPGTRARWVTEITAVRPGEFFVDEQRLGPYRFWHHQHRLRAVSGGVEVEDLVHYALPLDPLSRPAHALLVAPRLSRIFAFRREALRRLFPGGAPVDPGRLAP